MKQKNKPPHAIPSQLKATIKEKIQIHSMRRNNLEKLETKRTASLIHDNKVISDADCSEYIVLLKQFDEDISYFEKAAQQDSQHELILEGTGGTGAMRLNQLYIFSAILDSPYMNDPGRDSSKNKSEYTTKARNSCEEFIKTFLAHDWTWTGKGGDFFWVEEYQRDSEGCVYGVKDRLMELVKKFKCEEYFKQAEETRQARQIGDRDQALATASLKNNKSAMSETRELPDRHDLGETVAETRQHKRKDKRALRSTRPHKKARVNLTPRKYTREATSSNRATHPRKIPTHQNNMLEEPPPKPRSSSEENKDRIIEALRIQNTDLERELRTKTTQSDEKICKLEQEVIATQKMANEERHKSQSYHHQYKNLAEKHNNLVTRFQSHRERHKCLAVAHNNLLTTLKCNNVQSKRAVTESRKKCTQSIHNLNKERGKHARTRAELNHLETEIDTLQDRLNQSSAHIGRLEDSIKGLKNGAEKLESEARVSRHDPAIKGSPASSFHPDLQHTSSQGLLRAPIGRDSVFCSAADRRQHCAHTHVREDLDSRLSLSPYQNSG